MTQPPPPGDDPPRPPEGEPSDHTPGPSAGGTGEARQSAGSAEPPLRAEPNLGGESADPDVTGVQDPYRPQSERPADPTNPYAGGTQGAPSGGPAGSYPPGPPPGQQGHQQAPYPGAGPHQQGTPGAYPSGQGSPLPYYAQQSPLSDADARLWATLAHVGVFVTGFVGPLIIWALFKDRSGLVRENAASATNFGILMTVATGIGSILTVVFIGLFILLAVWVLALVCGILGAIKAHRGEVYGYPFNVKFVK